MTQYEKPVFLIECASSAFARCSRYGLAALDLFSCLRRILRIILLASRLIHRTNSAFTRSTPGSCCGPQRLRLLKRERERQSMRWKQFELLITGGAAMPEPGFAWALFHAITGDAKTGKLAVEWALGPGTDLRQLAIVFDWCQDALTESQTAALAAKIQRGDGPTGSSDMIVQRSRALGAIAVAEQNMDLSEKILREIDRTVVETRSGGALEKGRDLDSGAELYALYELLHAVRDNLTLDLRLSAPGYFKNLPAYEIANNYPNPFRPRKMSTGFRCIRALVSRTPIARRWRGRRD